MLKFRDAMFQLVLADYPFEAIQKAFVEHVSRSSDLPTPHDILIYLDHSKKPWCKNYYNALQSKAKRGEWLYSDERKYISDYESEQLKKIK